MFLKQEQVALGIFCGSWLIIKLYAKYLENCDWPLIIPHWLALTLELLNAFQMFAGIKMLSIMWFYEQFVVGFIRVIGIYQNIGSMISETLKQNFPLCEYPDPLF